VLLSGVQGITDLITTPGLINLDFADVKSVMSNAGSALMGIGSARGEDRSVAAAEMAISSPLLEASIDGAHGVLLSVSGGSDLGLFEINEAANLVAQAAHDEANIIFGAVIDDALGDEVRVTVIAAGFDGGTPQRRTAAAIRRPEPVGHDAGQPTGDARPRDDRFRDDVPRSDRLRDERNGDSGNGAAPSIAVPVAERDPVGAPSSKPAGEPARPVREPRRMVPASNDDLDVPDFLK